MTLLVGNAERRNSAVAHEICYNPTIYHLYKS